MTIQFNEGKQKRKLESLREEEEEGLADRLTADRLVVLVAAPLMVAMLLEFDHADSS
jgi:hypothetical protein